MMRREPLEQKIARVSRYIGLALENKGIELNEEYPGQFAKELAITVIATLETGPE